MDKVATIVASLGVWVITDGFFLLHWMDIFDIEMVTGKSSVTT